MHLPALGLPRCSGDLPRGSSQPPDEFRQRNREKAAGGREGLQTDNFNKVAHLLSDRRAASLASPPPSAASRLDREARRLRGARTEPVMMLRLGRRVPCHPLP